MAYAQHLSIDFGECRICTECQAQLLRLEKSNKKHKKLNAYFESIVEIPRIKVGKRQTLETLINEESLLLAKYLRNDNKK